MSNEISLIVTHASQIIGVVTGLLKKARVSKHAQQKTRNRQKI